jgi:ketosteroid isomerase-like protein
VKYSVRVIAAFLAAACSAGASAANKFEPDISGVLQPVNSVIAAVKSDDPSAISALYSSDAVVVDDRQPFEWNGVAAGSHWLADVSDWTKWSRKVATFRSIPSDIQIGDNDKAYVVVAAQFSSADPKKAWTRDGTLTFTLRKVAGVWKISSQVWAESFHHT